MSSQCQLYGWEHPTYLARGWREGEGTLGRAAHDFLEGRKKTPVYLHDYSSVSGLLVSN